MISLLINSLESCRPKPVAGRHLRSQPQICVAASWCCGTSLCLSVAASCQLLAKIVTDYLLIPLLFQSYSCVCRSLRSPSASFHQPHEICQTTCLPTHLPFPTLPTDHGGCLSRQSVLNTTGRDPARRTKQPPDEGNGYTYGQGGGPRSESEGSPDSLWRKLPTIMVRCCAGFPSYSQYNASSPGQQLRTGRMKIT